GEATGRPLRVETIGGPEMGPAVGQQVNVEAAIVVVVEKGGPGADDLGKEILAGGPGVVDEVEAELRGDLLEPGGAILFGGGPGRGVAGGGGQDEGPQQVREKAGGHLDPPAGGGGGWRRGRVFGCPKKRGGG